MMPRLRGMRQVMRPYSTEPLLPHAEHRRQRGLGLGNPLHNVQEVLERPREPIQFPACHRLAGASQEPVQFRPDPASPRPEP
jgi:hypothetical protein